MNRLFVAVFASLAPMTVAAEPELKKAEWKIGDDVREALIAAPAKSASQPAPLVFCWHGHGGTMGFSARSFAIHKVWPEAIVVYPQGLKTPSQLVDPTGKMLWARPVQLARQPATVVAGSEG